MLSMVKNLITPEAENKPTHKEPNYKLRRALAALALAGVVSGLGGLVVNGIDRIKEASHAVVPNPEEAQKHPEKYVKRPVDENLSQIATEYTDNNHNIEPNVDNLVDQAAEHPTFVMVPPNTVDPDKR